MKRKTNVRSYERKDGTKVSAHDRTIDASSAPKVNAESYVKPSKRSDAGGWYHVLDSEVVHTGGNIWIEYSTWRNKKNPSLQIEMIAELEYPGKNKGGSKYRAYEGGNVWGVQIGYLSDDEDLHDTYSNYATIEGDYITTEDYRTKHQAERRVKQFMAEYSGLLEDRRARSGAWVLEDDRIEFVLWKWNGDLKMKGAYRGSESRPEVYILAPRLQQEVSVAWRVFRKRKSGYVERDPSRYLSREAAYEAALAYMRDNPNG